MAAHTTKASEVAERYQPIHLAEERGSNGDMVLYPGDSYISKIQVNGNILYSAAPTTVINIFYADDEVGEMHIYGPLYRKTIDVSIGVTLHMMTLLGRNLKVNGPKNGRIITRMADANTTIRTDIWGYKVL